MNTHTLLRVALEIAPYVAIAALCLGILIAWILRADEYRKTLGKPADISAGFLISLASILFIVFLIVSATSIVENSRLRQEIVRRDMLLVKAAAEKRAAERNVDKMKGEVRELRAQKALYTATIETLAKK